MKSTAFGGRLLLLAVLAVSWVAAVPASSQVDPQQREALEKFLEQNPSVAKDLYPQLVKAAKHVSLDVDPDVVLDLVENYVKDAVVEESAVSRQKRSFTFAGVTNTRYNNSKTFAPEFGHISNKGSPIHFDFRNLFG